MLMDKMKVKQILMFTRLFYNRHDADKMQICIKLLVQILEECVIFPHQIFFDCTELKLNLGEIEIKTKSSYFSQLLNLMRTLLKSQTDTLDQKPAVK